MATARSPCLQDIITVPELLDFHYEHNPDEPIFVFVTHDDQDGVTEISYLEFVRACHRFAHIIRPNRSGDERQVVAVVALVDTLVYETIIAGTMEAGLVPLLISPRNSAVAITNLLKKGGAHRLLTTHATLKELINGVKTELESSDESGFDVSFEEIPGLVQLYPNLGVETAAHPFQPYPACPVRPDTQWTAMILHSSGSTGLPKAIPQSHRSVQSWAAFPSGTELRDYSVPLRPFSASLPPFHGYAFYAQLASALFNSLPIALYTPVVTKPDMQPIMPTPENILSHLQRTKCNCLITVPSMVQAWSHSKSDIDILRSLELVICSGGPLPPAIGDSLVSEGVHLRAIYGGTEFAIPTAINLYGDRTDWQWLRFSEKAHINWAPQGDGTYECQFLAVESHAIAVNNMLNHSGYATSDLFLKHPTKPDLWKVVGRLDDVLVHSSGEKTVPAPIENMLLQSPLILGAVMFGRQRDQPGILIEPTPGHEVDSSNFGELSHYRNKIWAVINEANQVAPAFSRIYKEMILLTSPGKPLPRAPKGTVMTKAAISAYEKEIDQMFVGYTTVESNANSIPPSGWNPPRLVQWLTDQVNELVGAVLSSSTDMFENGLDSLSATILRLRIVTALRGSEIPLVRAAFKLVTQNIVYQHPSIENLANHIGALINSKSHAQSSIEDIEIDEHIRAMEGMIMKYSKGLADIASNSIDHDGSSPPSATVVLLTGSTGSLGAHILATLIGNCSVNRIYTLNRPSVHSPVFDRHKSRFMDRGLDPLLLDAEKVVYLEGDSGLPSLGLSPEVYGLLRTDVTLIIHNAWRLDFNLSLSSFETHIRSVRNLIDLARSSQYSSSLRFLFTSSISSAQAWNAPEKGPYPEEIVKDAKSAVGMGYGESKYVSERILANSGLSTTSLRIGQISGGKSNGAWAASDWFPLMIKTSFRLNMLPDARGVISWIPVDAVANSIIDVGLSKENHPAVNLVHPRPISWSYMIREIRKTVIAEKKLDSHVLPLVPIQTWVNALVEVMHSEAKSVEDEAPAGKILGFYRDMALADVQQSGKEDDVEAVGFTALATAKIQRLSPKIRSLEPLSACDIARWVVYWVRSGL